MSMKPKPRYKPEDKIGGRYLVHQALMGSMGEVYLCLDLERNYPFALKTFQSRFFKKRRIVLHSNMMGLLVMETQTGSKLERIKK